MAHDCSFENFENTAFRIHLGDMISDFNNTDGCFDEFHDGFQQPTIHGIRIKKSHNEQISVA